MKGVLIGGGSGFVGTALTNSLKQKGYNVKVISRKPGPFNMTWGVVYMSDKRHDDSPMTDLEKNGLPPNTGAVVSMAGQNIFDITRRWSPGFKQNVSSSRVNTTASLAKAINDSRDKPNVFISMSGVGFYKPSDKAKYDEDSPGGNFDFLSELATAWENASVLAPSSQNLRRVIIRSGVVLGRQGGVIKQMFWPFWFGLGGPVASGQQFFPWIHITDIVNLIIFSMENNGVNGILNGVAPQVITNKQFASALGRALWRPALIPLPAFVLNAAFSEERAKIMTEGQHVIPKRTQELGFIYKYPDIDSACKQCVSSAE